MKALLACLRKNKVPMQCEKLFICTRIYIFCLIFFFLMNLAFTLS